MFTCDVINALFCTHYIGNVIYHKFSHDDVFYRFNGENVNVMIECLMKLKKPEHSEGTAGNGQATSSLSYDDAMYRTLVLVFNIP